MYVERLSIYIGTSSNITLKMSSPQPENSVKETSSPLAKNAIKVQWFTTFQWVFFMVAFILTATALGSCNEIKFSNTSGTQQMFHCMHILCKLYISHHI